jgi:hypothetical protein
VATTFYAVQSYSRLMQLVYRIRQGELRHRVSPVSPLPEHELENRIYQEPKDKVWREAWGITERLICQMHDELKRREMPFGVVTASNPIQAHPDPAVRRAVMERLHVADLFYPDRRIKKLGERRGFSVLNLAPLFQKYADDHQVFLHGFKNTALGTGHWNENGHKLAASLIADWLSREGMLPQLKNRSS